MYANHVDIVNATYSVPVKTSTPCSLSKSCFKWPGLCTASTFARNTLNRACGNSTRREPACKKDVETDPTCSSSSATVPGNDGSPSTPQTAPQSPRNNGPQAVGTFAQRKRILSNVTANVRPGELFAIIGPSGSGKTSLLNLISGRAEHDLDDGEILFGGMPRNPRTKRILGYVQQDDVFFSRLTIHETLQFAASLRGDGVANMERRDENVDLTIRRLRLEKCQHTAIGNQQFKKGISGGERKRLNIAYELLADPQVLLLDEPTSGQDASNAMSIVRLLRDIANEGKTIILTIHQPSSAMFALFDKLMVLSEGKVAYFGRADQAEDYFSSVGYPFPQKYNPCDYILQLLIDDVILKDQDGECIEHQLRREKGVPPREHLVQIWENRIRERRISALTDLPACEGGEEEAGKSMASTPHRPPSKNRQIGIQRAIAKRLRNMTGQADPLGLPDKYETNWWNQVKVLGVRALRQRRGRLFDPVIIIQFLLITFVCSVFWFRISLSESALNDRLGALFFYVAFWGFLTSGSAVHTFPPEKAVLSKDRASGSYRLSAYYFAKCVMETPVDVVYPVLFATIVYWINRLNPRFVHFVVFTIVFTLSTLVAQGFGLFFSAVFLDAQNAQTLSLLWNLSSMLMAGYYVRSDNVPAFIRPFNYLSYVRYAFAALVRNEVSSMTYECVNPQEGGIYTTFSLNGKSCPHITGKDVLIGSELDSSPVIAVDIVVLLLMIVIFRVLGYLALKYLHRSHKMKHS